jgi:hypothetical protein
MIQILGSRNSLITTQEQQAKGFNYGFVEYDDPGAAERAMQTLNGRRVHQAVSVLKTALVMTSDTFRKFASIGLTNPTPLTRRIPLITSTFLLVIFPTRSMMKSCSRPFLLSAPCQKLVLCGT